MLSLYSEGLVFQGFHHNRDKIWPLLATPAGRRSNAASSHLRVQLLDTVYNFLPDQFLTLAVFDLTLRTTHRYCVLVKHVKSATDELENDIFKIVVLLWRLIEFDEGLQYFSRQVIPLAHREFLGFIYDSAKIPHNQLP